MDTGTLRRDDHIAVADGGQGAKRPRPRSGEEPEVTGPAQVQALTYKDLQQVDGVNLNGVARAIYFYGEFNGVVRPRQKGGDLIQLTDGPNAGTWLITHVLETWPDWCKVAVVLQNDQG